MHRFHPRFASNKGSKNNDECHRCGKIGHWARDCEQPRNIPYSNTKMHESRYRSISGTHKYTAIDTQIAESTAKSYYGEHNPILNIRRYESQLIKFIESNQFNNTVHMLHIMMQQRIKLNNISLFPSILQCIKLCKTHNFHILELIDYMKYNRIELDSNRFSQILGICVAKNDLYSAQQIAILWFETQPDFPVLSVIHCLSSQNSSTKPNYKYHKLGKQEKIWQSIINKLTLLSQNKHKSLSDITLKYMEPISSKEYISERLSEIQLHLTAKNHDLVIHNLHELHTFITTNNDDISILKQQNKGWTQWLLKQELMNGDIHKIESNDTLRKIHELGFKYNNSLLQEIQKPLSLTNMDLSTPNNSELIRFEMMDHVHELERRLPFIIKFISYNMDIGMIPRDIIHQVISLVIDTTLKTKTAHVPNKVIDGFFRLISTYDLFHKDLFNYLKQNIISQHQRIKEDGSDHREILRHSGYISLRKLLEFMNGFSKKQLEECRKIQELRDILPLMQHCCIQSFYAKSKYFAKQLKSKDLSDAIVEAAFRLKTEELGDLLYYLFHNYDMVPLEMDWRDLHKIYATLLGLTNQAMNELKDIDIMHLLNYTPLPVNNTNESDIVNVVRKRQQRVLRILTGIYARHGSFDEVMKSIHYFDHDTVITANMRSYATFYLNETLLHCFTKHCVDLKKDETLSDGEYIERVKEMTQNIYKKWRECTSQILDIDTEQTYSKYLLCIENLCSQIRMRQIVPLGQYLLYILDECNIAPTWNMYDNLWFAFNVGDKYMPQSYNNDDIYNNEDNEDKDDIHEFEPPQFQEFSFSQFMQSSNALSTVSAPVNYSNILDTKYHELQSKYMSKDHIDYLLEHKRAEEAILMLNKYKLNITDKYKLNCVKQYVIDGELRNNYHNYYPFAVSHWFPISEPICAKYFVQRRIDVRHEHGVIVSYDWHRKTQHVFIDCDKDILLYIPHYIMKQTRYKTAILRHCRDDIFDVDNEQFGHLELEILPYSHNIERKKLELNAMKREYDLFVIRGCQSLEEKLAIWSRIIAFFEKDLNILSTVSCDYYPSHSIRNSVNITFNHQLTKFMQSICAKYKCKIDANCISSFKFDQIPTFFIWLKDDEKNNLGDASNALKEYLTSSSNHLKENAALLIEIPSKYHSALHKMFYSTHHQISKDLKYVRDARRHDEIDVNIFAKDIYDSSKGGVLSINAPSRSLRRRVYQQILYSHPPSNDTNIRIHDKKIKDAMEWKDIDNMLFDLISSISDDKILTISNAIYVSRLQHISHAEWMMNLFVENHESLMSCADEMVKLCQLIFSALSLGQNGSFNQTAIAQIFYNILTNDSILDMCNQESISQLLYCTILSLCNHSQHYRSLSITDFHRIRAAFLHCYCGHSKNDEDGINENLSLCLSELTQYQSYMMIFLEYLYLSCLMNNPNLSGYITRFLNELLTLMVHETNLDSSTYSQFCSSAADLLLIDIQSPQQHCARSFIDMYRHMDNMDDTHAIYSQIDVESLKIILSELNPLEIEHINVSYKTIRHLYKNICSGCSLCGNVECIKLLLNRIEFLSKSYQTKSETDDVYTFGIDETFLNEICQNVWNYYHNIIGYDIEMSIHYIMQLIESMLSTHAHIISTETLTQYAILMAQNTLIYQMYSLKQLIETTTSHQHKFDTLIKVLNDVDYEVCYHIKSYHHIKSV